MKKFFAIALMAAIFPASAFAETLSVEKWEGPIGGGSGSLMLTKIGGNISADLDVGAEGCGAEVKGNALENSEVILIMSDPSDPTSCVISLYKKGGAIVEEAEQGDCTNYHGASCDFSNPHMVKAK